MAVISTSGISPLQVIKSEHLLRIINALTGITSTDIIVSGSLSVINGINGSLFGTSSYALTSSITTAITGSAGYIPVFSGARTLVNSSMIYENNGGDNIGIGTNSPERSAIIELNSDRKGFLPPRMTSSEMNAIDSPAQGLMVYNTSEKQVAVYVNSGWRFLAFV
jgi:hypothetical protein